MEIHEPGFEPIETEDGGGEWKPLAETPRPGGWQRIAARMGYAPTPALLAKVEVRRRKRRGAGLARQVRLDGPLPPTPGDVESLMGKMDEVMDMILENRNRRNISAPPRPTDPPPSPPRSIPRHRTGKGGIQLS